jgi:hypothetical protein
MSESDAARELYDALVAEYLPQPRVAQVHLWDRDGVTVAGTIFAMYADGELAVRLPLQQATALLRSLAATPFELIPGYLVREWVQVPLTDSRGGRRTWRSLFWDAYRYARAARG